MPKTATNPKRRETLDATSSNAFMPPNTLHGLARPFSKAELCEWLNCSPKYIESEVNKGNLRVLRMSNKMIRFAAADIEAWLASKAV
jgi:hypothetical protein